MNSYFQGRPQKILRAPFCEKRISAMREKIGKRCAALLGEGGGGTFFGAIS